MNLTPKQKAIAGIAALCLLLIITNPSVSAFKTYRGKNTCSGLKRPLNLFICSVYQDHYGDKYLALFGNFINITYHPEPVKVVAVPDMTYKDRVYIALKENLSGFNTSKSDFEVKIKDRSYALKVYSALKDNLTGFNKSEDEFIDLVNQ